MVILGRSLLRRLSALNGCPFIPQTALRRPARPELPTPALAYVNRQGVKGNADLSRSSSLAHFDGARGDQGMRQTSFASLVYTAKKRQTRREGVLGEMQQRCRGRR
jgi:hypothetical protein